MIRKLTEADRKQTLEFLYPEAALNSFIIGDIEQYGFDKDFQKIWGSFDVDGKLNALLLHYENNYIPYSPYDDYDFSPFMFIVKTDRKPHIISGKSSIITSIQKNFKNYLAESTNFCELKTPPAPKPCPYEIKIAQPQDAPRISQMLNEIEEFKLTSPDADPKQIERTLATKAGRIYYTENSQGIIQNVVQSAAENSFSAMIVGVATRKPYRHQGLMSSCLSKLCYDLNKEGNKSLCLFYDNPEAGKIYHNLGFETIDHWTMLTQPVNK